MTVTHFSRSGFTPSWGAWRCAGIVSLLLLTLLGAQTLAASTNGAAPTANRPAERGTGITYIHDEIADVPWSIHLVKVDRRRADLQFETTLGANSRIGMSLVSDQLKKVPTDLGRAVAAVNGDFYRLENNKYLGDPYGVQILHGELISAPVSTRSCFWIGANGEPRITNVFPNLSVTFPNAQPLPIGLNEDRAKDAMVLYTAAIGTTTGTSGGTEVVLARGTNQQWLPLQIGQTYSAVVKEIRAAGDTKLDGETLVLSVGPKVSAQVAGLKVGDAVTFSTATTPSMTGAMTAIGGGPALIHGGVVGKFTGLQKREPRTTLGWNKDYYYLMVVDGRQRASVGMTFAELAKYMREKLGCDEALNLDGGGSATLWVYGHVMNSPSEGRERPAANALVVVRKDQSRIQTPVD